MSFNGFISYSHAADGRLAPAVQRGLHRLAKPWHRRRALWIFRDQTGLAVTPALWSSIQKAMDSSDYFVLMASPEAARSPWVNREVEHWVATKSAEKILPVVTDGEWRWDPRAKDFDTASTAVPPALRGVFTEEPLYLDLRWARNDQQLNLRHSRFRDAIAQLAAPMHGVSKDDLEGEDVRRHRRAAQLRWSAVTSLVMLTLLASVTGMFAVRNAAQANESAAEARKQQVEASVQRGSAARYADEAHRQEDSARTQEARAKDAASEAARQTDAARTQKGLAERASAETKRQLAKADQAAARARQQQQLAQRQSVLARESAREMRRQQDRAKEQERIAREQQKLAGQAGAEAARQKKIADQQQRLAAEAAELARQQEQIAKEQEQRAKEAGAEAARQLRISVSRRLVNEAKAAIGYDPPTALQLGAAATSIHSDGDIRREVANLVTSTRHAGSIDNVAVLAYGPGSLLATAAENGVVSLWDVRNRANPVRLAIIGDAGNAIRAMAWRPDGKTLVILRDGLATLWDVADPSRPAALTSLPGQIYDRSARFSPDGKVLAVGQNAAYAYASLWDVTDRTQPAKLSTLTGRMDNGPIDAAGKFAFSGDGNTVAVARGMVAVWDITDRAQPVERSQIVTREGAKALAFSPTRPQLAVGDSSGALTLYDVSDLAQPGQYTKLTHAANVPVVGATYSPDGATLVSADNDGTVIVWAADDYPREMSRMKAHGVNALSMSEDAGTIATADHAGTAVFWNVAEFAAPKRLTDLTVASGQLRAMRYGTDGKSLITIGADGTATFFDVVDRKRWKYRAAFPIHRGRMIDTAAISADGRTVLASGNNGDLTMTDVTDPANPAIFATMNLGAGGTDVLAFSADGNLALVGGAGRLLVWDITDHRSLERRGTLELPGFTTGLAAFSPDGRTVVVADNRKVSVWDVTNLDQPVQTSTLSGHGNSIETMAFSPDGKTLATGSFDRTAILWDVSDRAKPLRLATLTGHTFTVTALTFSADGRSLATADALGWALVWDVAQPTTPVRMARLQLDTNHTAVHMGFTANANTLAIGTDYTWEAAAVGLWDLTELNDLRADPDDVACAIAGRGLGEREWARHIPELQYQRTCP